MSRGASRRPIHTIGRKTSRNDRKRAGKANRPGVLPPAAVLDTSLVRFCTVRMYRNIETLISEKRN